jgi:two-component system chemotaxis response regulator CheY
MPDIPARKRTVLIADDEPTIRFALRLMLRANDYDVIGEAGSGDKALEGCRQLKPELLLLDINMPGLDGLQVLDKLRQSQPNIRVIIISGDSTLDRVEQSLAKGASGFIVKPFNAEKVLSDIAAALPKVSR